jgi:hypothetical protein
MQDPTLNSAVTPDLLLLFISGKQLSPSVPDLPFPLYGTSFGASSLIPPTLSLACGVPS